MVLWKGESPLAIGVLKCLDFTGIGSIDLLNTIITLLVYTYEFNNYYIRSIYCDIKGKIRELYA